MTARHRVTPPSYRTPALDRSLTPADHRWHPGEVDKVTLQLHMSRCDRAGRVRAPVAEMLNSLLRPDRYTMTVGCERA